ncbi:FecCD family ABC transporter permease [Nonomuraea roseoviolacea]|uniref:Iron complex transport system permease protein n=1 Tax=Nonomuraea roseoviolacea subsp. carminata TaxID=160689 RepID=A0ABT1KFU7_9ACTN|nr:iron ABC transporter permease [Nonomuraea roseoviolacea]MCP2352877.1 iron complex transport system permease protein [Nonomuraea roseoviolacea subsp. carminata]
MADTLTHVQVRPAPPRRPHLVSGPATGVLLAALVAGLVAALVAGISVGSVNLPLGQVWGIVWAHLSGRGAQADPLLSQVVWDIRTPRALLAALAGAGLSVAGVALQALVRNPLADPYVLGVSSAASLGAVLVPALGGTALAGLTGALGVTGAAFAAAVLSALLVYVLAQRSGRLLDSWLVLTGVAIGYLCTAATTFVQLQLNPTELQGMMFWLMGSVAGASWTDLGVPALLVVSCLAWLWLQARSLNALLAGEEAAVAIGVPVARLRIGLLVAGSLLTATVVSVVGGIGFIGLMVPHMVRFVVGADHRRVLPVSLLAGALFLVLVDLAARIADRPNELPVGIFTTGLGVPFFLWLLRRRARGGSDAT